MLGEGMRAPAVGLVIFDCDGVLVDSEPISNRVFCEMLNDLGLALTLDDMFEHFVGLSMPQCISRVTVMLGAPPPEGFVASLQERTQAALKDVKPMPSVAEVLSSLSIPYCVASSGNHAKICRSLGAAGLYARFAGKIFSVADVASPKPAPDVFLYAARAMGAKPDRCVVVEDTPTGVRAGVAAGMRVFGFCAHTPAERLQQAGAHIVFDDMRALPRLLSESTGL